MPLPSDVSVFTLKGGQPGGYIDATGAVVQAGVSGTLTPVDANGLPITVVHASDGATIVPAAIPVTIEHDGTWTVANLAHTDDPHLSPQNFLYQLTWNVPAYRSVLVNKKFAAPIVAGTTINYDTIVPDGGTTPLVYVPATAHGVPAGGTTGQSLVKASNADYDAAWSTVSGGGGAGSLLAANNLSDVASAATARSNLGLGSAATQPTSAFDAAGAAAARRANWNARTVTAAATAALDDYILADTTGGTFAVTAPAPAAGRVFGVKWKAGTTAPTLSGTFNGTPTFAALDQAMEFIADGTTWYRTVRPSLAQLPDFPSQTGNGGKFLTTDGTNTSWGSAASNLLTFNTQSGTTYTFALADGNGSTQVEFTSASAVAATIPPHSSVAYPVGSVLLISQYGTGQVTVTPGAGVTLHAPNGAKTAQQYSVVSVVQRAFDEWTVSGDATL